MDLHEGNVPVGKTIDDYFDMVKIDAHDLSLIHIFSNGAHLLICSICISLLAACTSLIAVWFGFRKKSATTVIISALILTAPMTNFASAGMYGWMSLAGFAAVMGALYFIVYRSLSRKVSLRCV